MEFYRADDRNKRDVEVVYIEEFVVDFLDAFHIEFVHFEPQTQVSIVEIVEPFEATLKLEYLEIIEIEPKLWYLWLGVPKFIIVVLVAALPTFVSAKTGQKISKGRPKGIFDGLF